MAASQPGICPKCQSSTTIVQPNLDQPERLLEVCSECNDWVCHCTVEDDQIIRTFQLEKIGRLAYEPKKNRGVPKTGLPRHADVI